ncbi:GTP pyrophosphokinase family protein [Planomicrobium sp. Y74]|uniref:GTP pyrophosphokinase n=1 Tax=Planomicrobium sp. Y74 TaxID=2478977 RepID=UPI000EF4C465|nr:GTP pyrophosphokinase family protein [Planomicrobium sp. Y74]RLQ92777.1 GTP pyrophosphokinase family protein [Planomicrobium sp. Y74]
MESELSTEINRMKLIKKELMRFLMRYKFALDEINTKVDILKQEFHLIHDYNPIENVNSRIKSPESIFRKIEKKNLELSIPTIKEHIRDIAGIRIICSFETDIYELSEMLKNQQDMKVLAEKDYIKNPKRNGYRSLHLLLEVPVYMSDGVEDVCVEVQIRTIAMDFWASLEHKIYYKYNKEVPAEILQELREAADSAAHLDKKMENIHKEMDKLKDKVGADEDFRELLISNERFHLPESFSLKNFKF